MPVILVLYDFKKRKIMKKHFVIFYSPGTFVSEESSKPIQSWDTKEAIKLAKDIKERHGAAPFGFQFTTRERKEDELDSKEIKRSNMYFLGGKIFTLEDIKQRNDPKDNILISNMECNGWDRVIENNNSWKITQPFEKDSVLLNYSTVYNKSLNSESTR